MFTTFPLGGIELEAYELNIVKLRSDDEQSVPNATNTDVQLDAIEIAVGTALIPPTITAGLGNDSITVVENGVYLIAYEADFDAAVGICVLEPLINGSAQDTPAGLIFTNTAVAGQRRIGKAIVLRLKANDVVKLRVLQVTGGALEIEAATLVVWQLSTE